jgi:hypothetical protein
MITSNPTFKVTFTDGTVLTESQEEKWGPKFHSTFAYAIQSIKAYL